MSNHKKLRLAMLAGALSLMAASLQLSSCEPGGGGTPPPPPPPPVQTTLVWGQGNWGVQQFGATTAPVRLATRTDDSRR